jgi:hypothetical protein
MNRDEAKFILRAYRSNCADARDPQFAASLALVKQDLEMAHWLTNEQALDAAIERKIRAAMPVPPDLKRQLLLIRSTARPAPWWGRLAWLGVAASFTLVLVLSGFWWSSRERGLGFSQFREAMLAEAVNMTRHTDVKGLDGDRLRRWLVDHRGEAGFVLPPGLAGNDIAACKTIDWQERRVTMLCFRPGSAHLDLFVVETTNFPAVADDSAPQFSASGTLSTAAWSRDGKHYLLVGNESLAALRRRI